jgi:hypothetical protein
MKNEGQNHARCLYTKDDLIQAFDMGLDSGLYVLEKSIGLPMKDRKYLLSCFKRMIKSDANQSDIDHYIGLD